MTDNYYTSQKLKLLKDFDKIAIHLRSALLVSNEPNLAETIIKETREEFEWLIPELPYIGGKKNRLTTALIEASYCLALYMVFKRQKRTAEEAGKVVYDLVRVRLESYPIVVVRLMGWYMSSSFMRNKQKAQCEESQKRLYPGDWLKIFVEGDGKDFDYGIDYTECGICKLFRKHDAEEFIPYLCFTDFPVSRALGTGLTRETAIGEGYEKCEFRFKKGREVAQDKWPPYFLKQ